MTILQTNFDVQKMWLGRASETHYQQPDGTFSPSAGVEGARRLPHPSIQPSSKTQALMRSPGLTSAETRPRGEEGRLEPDVADPIAEAGAREVANAVDQLVLPVAVDVRAVETERLPPVLPLVRRVTAGRRTPSGRGDGEAPPVPGSDGHVASSFTW